MTTRLDWNKSRIVGVLLAPMTTFFPSSAFLTDCFYSSSLCCVVGDLTEPSRLLPHFLSVPLFPPTLVLCKCTFARFLFGSIIGFSLSLSQLIYIAMHVLPVGRRKAFWCLLSLLLWSGVAQSASLRALLTSNNDASTMSSSSSTTTVDKSDVTNNLSSNLPLTTVRSTTSAAQSSSSNIKKNAIPNYAAMPEYQVFFGADSQPSTSSSSTFSSRIVGGVAATPNRYFTMQLTQNATTGSWHFAGCSGTLISPCHILTAAHCVAGNRQGILQGLYVGAYSPFSGNSGYPYHFSAPQAITIHPSFDPVNDVNDVAVIRMQQCVDTSQFPPATVATPSLLDTVVTGQPVTAMGFGRLSMTSNVQVQTLQSVNLQYYSTSFCNALYQPYGNTVYSDMICAGVKGGGKDACQGDSGGPLVLTNTSTIIGVVSWGRGCAVADFPGVYNSVASHYTWIQTQVCGDSGVTSISMPLCLNFASRVSASVPAPLRNPPSVPTVVGARRPAPTRRPIRRLPPPSPRPTLRPSTRTSLCNTNIHGSFTYTTSTGAVLTLECSRMIVGLLGHKVCSQRGAIQACPKACNPVCQI